MCLSNKCSFASLLSPGKPQPGHAELPKLSLCHFLWLLAQLFPNCSLCQAFFDLPGKTADEACVPEALAFFSPDKEMASSQKKNGGK